MLEKLKNSNKIDNPVDDKLLNDAINEYEKLLSYLVLNPMLKLHSLCFQHHEYYILFH